MAFEITQKIFGTRPSTYFGFNPKVTKEDVREKLERFRTHDTKITAMSRAFDLELGTGWYVPPGVLHAHGSLLTYEPHTMKALFNLISVKKPLPPLKLLWQTR
jgi:hypothetical protein